MPSRGARSSAKATTSAVGVANLVTLYAPEVIALSGSVMDSADLFMPIIRAVVLRSCGLVPAASVELVPAALGNDAPLIGAGAVWRHRYGQTLRDTPLNTRAKNN